VLAYYFSRKNFESASQSVERMVTLTTEQRLGQLLVQKEMLRPGQITVFQIAAGKSPKDVLLKDLRIKLGDKITRIPVVDSNGVVLYIVHQSGLFKFIAEKALAGGANIEKLTLQDLVDDAELKNWVTNIVYIPESASVADAKKKMDEQKGCQDLIVTKTGSNAEPMLGWMTNVDIGRLSKA
jgi:CBS domain-containing protein